MTSFSSAGEPPEQNPDANNKMSHRPRAAALFIIEFLDPGTRNGVAVPVGDPDLKTIGRAASHPLRGSRSSFVTRCVPGPEV